MHAARHCRFVSKSDVQGWPLIGTLATAAGTLYIERSSRRDALRMVRSMQEALERGEVLAVFPEGTTGDGREMLPFHANLLQAAVAAKAPVQPRRPALCRQGHGRHQFCSQLHRRRNPGGLDLAHAQRPAHRGRGALRPPGAGRRARPPHLDAAPARHGRSAAQGLRTHTGSLGSQRAVFVRQKRAYSTLWALQVVVQVVCPAQCPVSSALSICLRFIAGLCTLPGGHHEPD